MHHQDITVNSTDVKMDNSTSSLITEVKHLEIYQFLVGKYLLGSREFCCRAIKSNVVGQGQENLAITHMHNVLQVLMV